MAELTCDCGSVLIRFPTSTPRCTTECCCDDCYDRLSHLAKRGGPSPEHGVHMRTKPMTVLHFDNRLTVVKGADLLRFFKLRPESGVVNMSAGCCNSFLCSENVLYLGNVVTVIEQDFGSAKPVDGKHQPEPVHHRPNLRNVNDQRPAIRTFPNDWIDEHVDFLSPLTSVWLDGAGEVTGRPEGWEDEFNKFMETMTGDVPEGLRGDKFGHIYADYKGEVEIVSTKVFSDKGAVDNETKAAISVSQ